MNTKALEKPHLIRMQKAYKEMKRTLFGNTLINKDVAEELINHYGGDAGHQTDVKTSNLGYGFIHYSFIRNIRPSRVLCIGSRTGYIPAICAIACKDNGYGAVDFVDAGLDEKDKSSWSGIGFWKKTNVEKHFSKLDLSSWLNFFLMTTNTFAKKFPSRRYDYIYIDGDHSYHGVKNDYSLFWSRLSKGGFMVFHDATVKNWGPLKNFGVWRLLKQIKKNKLILPLDQSGLAIVQK